MITLDTAQRSEAWYEARRGMPTASRFDMILTPKTGKPAAAQETLINELIAESVLPPQEGAIVPATEEMYEGMKLEAEARCYYELEQAKAPVTQVGFCIHDSGLFGCSPDGLVGEDGGLELKVPLAKTHIGYVREGVLPDAYKTQVHGSMIVTGRKWWDFFSYSRHFEPFHIRVERDAFTERLQDELYFFCRKYNNERIKFGLKPIEKPYDPHQIKS